MSIVNLWLSADRSYSYLAADSAAFHVDTLKATDASKVLVIPHLHSALAIRGSHALLVSIAANAFALPGNSMDDLVGSIHEVIAAAEAGVLKYWREHNLPMHYLNEGAELFAAGWGSGGAAAHIYGSG